MNRNRAIFIVCALLAVLSFPFKGEAQVKASEPAIAGVVKHICSDGGEWLRCYSLEPSRCEEITSGYVRPCITDTFATASQEQLGVQVLHKLMECFNQQFISKYGTGKVNSIECNDPPKHLQ